MTKPEFANTGTGELVFFAVCTPRITYDAYDELEC
jgi:hypothetical protein